MYENRILPVIRPDFVTEILPNYFVTDYPNLVQFLQYYYESMDSEGGFGEISKDLYHITNIGITELRYLDNLFYELGLNVSKDLFQNPREVLRSLANFFRTKGSESSLKQFFKMFYNAEAEVRYPKDQIFFLNEDQSRLSDPLKLMQDGKLYQILSLFIKSPIGYKEYEELYKKFVHPAGFYVGALAEIYPETQIQPSGFQDSNIVDNDVNIEDNKILEPQINVFPILKSDIGNSDILVFDGETIQGVSGNTFEHDFDKVLHYTEDKWFIEVQDQYIPNTFLIDSGESSQTIVEVQVSDSNIGNPSDIFNTWYRFSHSPSNPPSYPARSSELLTWDYDSANDAIVCTLNTGTYVGFISEYSGENYKISSTISSPGADDDVIGIVLAYTEDSSREYTLSALRTMGGFTPTEGWAVYYNYRQFDGKEIASLPVSTSPNRLGKRGWQAHGPSRIEAEKTGDKIVVYTSQNGSTDIDSGTEIVIDLRADNDLKKFIGLTKNGYSAFSQNKATFTEIENTLELQNTVTTVIPAVPPTILTLDSHGYTTILETAGHNVRTALSEAIHDPSHINIAALDPTKTVQSEDDLYPPSLSAVDPTATYSIFEAPPNKVGLIQRIGLPYGTSSFSVDLKNLWGYGSDKILKKDAQKFLTRVYRKTGPVETEIKLFGLHPDPSKAFVLDSSITSSFELDDNLPVIRIDDIISDDGIVDMTIQNDLIDLDLSEVFNTWYRFSHNLSDTYPASPTEVNAWVYDEGQNAIVCTQNTSTYVGFISERSGTNYAIESTLSSTGSDDDTIGLVLAYVEQGGREYTLSAIRTMGGLTPTGGWGLYYNYGQSDSKQLAVKTVSTLSAASGGWNTHGPSRIEAQRSGDSIIAYTSQNGSTTIDPTTELTVDLSLDSDLYKFQGATRNGYSARSQDQASFTDIVNDLQAPLVDLTFVFSYKYNTIYDWIKYDSNAVFDINNFVYPDNRNIREINIQDINNRNIMYLKDTLI